MNNSTSIFDDIINDVYTATDFDTAIKIVKTRIEESKINDHNRAKMLRLDLPPIERSKSLPKLQKYITNSMLKKHGF